MSLRPPARHPHVRHPPRGWHLDPGSATPCWTKTLPLVELDVFYSQDGPHWGAPAFWCPGIKVGGQPVGFRRRVRKSTLWAACRAVELRAARALESRMATTRRALDGWGAE